jgi:uroporphyrinogen III methyltransferase/synthase
MKNSINWPGFDSKPHNDSKPGRVYLVGAGPGDPDLITLRALNLLRRADVVVYDYLVNPVLLEETKPGAQVIYAGKRAGTHSMSQEGINNLLVKFGLAGNQVVRLKGGDPFVFGRGGEEAEALVEAGIAFEIVPGISSAVAVAAYAGIPLTHRDYSSSFTVLTGHEKGGATGEKGGDPIPWDALVKLGGTLVFLMGVGQLSEMVANLVAAGKPASTPVALIEWGTTSRQKTVTGTLADIVALVEAAGLKPPAVTVIGPVVSLREKLRWFDLPVPGFQPDMVIREPELLGSFK